MKPLLINLAERIGWSKTDIDLDLLLTYYRERRMGDDEDANVHQQLNRSNPATQVLRHFVDLRYKMERSTFVIKWNALSTVTKLLLSLTQNFLQTPLLVTLKV